MSFPELINIVDENDQVIDTIERSEQWNKTRPDTHRIMNVFLFNNKGQILVQKRRKDKSMNPLKYDASVGGMVKAAQSYYEAAQEEMSQEIGIASQLLELGKFPLILKGENKIHSFNSIYVAVSTDTPKNWQKEAESIHWFSEAELEVMIKQNPEQFTEAFIAGFDFLQQTL